ncbi:sensor histidine kinase [Allokutzneria albata]|uniref:histidine kinase n=1 Tax=Allokutzneria albata TaxID=211114 RepID=A0A1G9W470_ALLAB|nr:nitrate- and nitrite sensing domain-containing protein [Allokutzneria albata]SDM79007.1 Signal transduction histidine kinase [Allokutzneria albata]
MKTDSEMNKSHKSIRTRLTGTVLIPSVALMVMWLGGASFFLFESVYVRAVLGGVRDVSIPAVTALASAEKERQLSMAYLGKPEGGLSELHSRQQQTDRSLTTMQTAANELAKNAPKEIVDRLNRLNGLIAQLPRMRARVDAKEISKPEIYRYYNEMLDAGTDLFETQARVLPDVTVALGGLTSSALFRANDLMSRETALIASALVSGTLTSAEHVELSKLVGVYHTELTTKIPFTRPGVQEGYQQLIESDAWKQLERAEQALINAGAWTSSGRNRTEPPITEAQWTEITTQVGNKLLDLTIQNADEVSAIGLSDADTALINVAIGTVAALIAAIASIVIALRVSRKLVDKALVVRLASLRNEALELAHRKLPNLVNRLRRGDTVKVSTEVPELDYGKDEIGQLASAFNAAQLTAVAAAVKEAQAREGINNVFLGIAHRNQGLVHRQLKILDRMERHEEDPEQLEGLFQLDHLATRARRNAENLIILGGEQPGRRWRNPIRLVDVLRAAISETEHYVRVRLQRVPEAAIIGSAVADTIHLVAELVDNATSFSPPRSQVQVHGSLAAKGVVVEVEDHGLGMSEEDQAAANAMLSDPPEFDAMALKGDSRLGLFVVARLAARLGVNVELRTSPYGGTRAIILIPNEVLASKTGPEDANPGTNPGLSRNPHTPPNGTPFPPQSRTEQTGVDQVTAHQRPAPTDSGARLGADLESFWSEPLSDEDSDGGRPLNLLGGLSFEAVREVPGPEPIADEPGSRPPVETPRYSHTGPIPVYTGNSQPEPPVPDTSRPGGEDSVRPRPALPQRKPQQSLAPQLRAEPAPVPQMTEDLAEQHRSAEEIRNTMSAFQRGTREGRNADSPFES